MIAVNSPAARPSFNDVCVVIFQWNLDALPFKASSLHLTNLKLKRHQQIFYFGDRSLLNILARVWTCPRMTGSPLLECFIIRPARFVQACTTVFEPQGGDVSLFAHGVTTETDFCTGTESLFFNLMQSRSDSFTVARMIGGGLSRLVCLYIYLFCFVITRAISSRPLWTDESFFCSRSVRLSIRSCVPLSFNVTNETCTTRWKISISSSALVQPVMLSVQNVFWDPNWKVTCSLQSGFQHQRKI